jgi:hypothetical protein
MGDIIPRVELICPECGMSGEQRRTYPDGCPMKCPEHGCPYFDKKEKNNALFSINDAAKWGVQRLRKPIWAIKLDHIKVDIINDKPGPWIHLYSPSNIAINGADPINLLCTLISYEVREWEPYTGPLPDSEEYKELITTYNMGR